MRTRSSSMGALWLLSLGLVVVMAAPASAAPKKKKKAVAAASAEAESEASSEGKSVDSLMEESATKKPKKAADDDEAPPAAAEPEEEVGEPDAWERPPVEEEKPKAVEAPKVEEKLGDGNQWELALTPGFGIKVGDADWSTIDPYGLGIGLRGGYELDWHLYLGAGFIYYLGNSKDDAYIQRGGSAVGPYSIKANYMHAYLEGGYNFWFGDLIFRPSMWLGMGFAVVDPHPQTNGLKTVSDFMLAPGAGLFYTWDDWMIGGDVRYSIVTADGAKGLTFFGNIGLRFNL
jgi:hypothetical protein